MPLRRIALVLGSMSVLGLLLVGCANPASMPQVHVKTAIRAPAHDAVVHISATGRSGGAYSGVVLTYPDGHLQMLGTACYGVGDIGRFQLDGLPSGVYTCTVYATPYETSDDSPADNGSGLRPFPRDKMVKKNVAAAETFAIP